MTCHLFCKKKERYGRSIVVCYFNSYIESNLTLSCIIQSKQNLLFESKCMFQTHSKNNDGYKALKILEVTSILNIQKDYCSGFIKNIRCINPALINTHLKLVNHFKNYHYCMIVRLKF